MNYFEYFSEVEERFVARRGAALLLSTLDWALIETWREAEVPLSAVLRGIDDAFDRYEARKARAKGRLGKVNGLAWCAQAVMAAAQEMTQAATGLETPRGAQVETGFEAARVAAFLQANARALQQAADTATPEVQTALERTARRLGELWEETRDGIHPALDELDRHLGVLEEQLHAAVVAAMPEGELLALRENTERELLPLRGRMGAGQLRSVRESLLQKRIWGLHRLPRLSLFYMPLADGEEGKDGDEGKDRREAAA